MLVNLPKAKFGDDLTIQHLRSCLISSNEHQASELIAGRLLCIRNVVSKSSSGSNAISSQQACTASRSSCQALKSMVITASYAQLLLIHCVPIGMFTWWGSPLSDVDMILTIFNLCRAGQNVSDLFIFLGGLHNFCDGVASHFSGVQGTSRLPAVFFSAIVIHLAAFLLTILHPMSASSHSRNGTFTPSYCLVHSRRDVTLTLVFSKQHNKSTPMICHWKFSQKLTHKPQGCYVV